ncbi:MAG: DNA polymerase beta superfamily protein [Oscillochloridaceae bacterium umkhey_bin13]
MPPVDTLLRTVVAEQPYPLLFASLSGAHLYGFPSPDSDYDLRGAHVLPLRDIVGLGMPRETIEVSADREGRELDLVTHDVAKFCRLLLRPNGYVLEQLCSPLVIHTTSTHAELRALVPRLVTRHHAHHYLGFAGTQWRLFEQERPPRVKPLLYVFRVLLTGIHLMRTGEVEANLVRLNEVFQFPYLGELIARKLAGPERGSLDAADVALFAAEYARLRSELETARETSWLPAEPGCRAEVNDLLVRVRLGEP